MTSSKFPFRIFGQRMESVSSGVTVGVQYLGEGVSWTDVVGVNDVGVKGVRDAKESPVVSVCEMVSSFRLQEQEW